MTFSKALIVAAVALTSSGLLACDKGSEAPAEPPAQAEPVDETWPSLLANLDAAENDDARATLLEVFVAEHPEHAQVAEARRRLEKIQGPKRAVNDLKAKALEEADPTSLAMFFVVASIPTLVTKELTEPLPEPLKFATPEGPMTLESSVLTTPSRVRSHVRRVLKAHAPTLIGERCREECLNEAINEVLEPAAGGPVIEGPGKLNRDAVGTLLEKAFVTPETEILGVPAANYYAAFQPTVRAYASVGKAVKAAGVEKAAQTLGTLSERREILGFYQKWTSDNKIVATSGISAKATGNLTSWWIRRYADGTGPVFADFLGKVVDSYDPEFAASLK